VKVEVWGEWVCLHDAFCERVQWGPKQGCGRGIGLLQGSCHADHTTRQDRSDWGMVVVTGLAWQGSNQRQQVDAVTGRTRVCFAGRKVNGDDEDEQGVKDE